MSSSTSSFPSVSGLVKGTISFSITLASIALILSGGLYLLISQVNYLATPLAFPYANAALVSMGVGFFINSRTSSTVMTRTGLVLFAILCVLYGLGIASKLPVFVS